MCIKAGSGERGKSYSPPCRETIGRISQPSLSTQLSPLEIHNQINKESPLETVRINNHQRRVKKMTKLKVYADRMSQPSRAIIIFCKVNGIDFEEIQVGIVKGLHKSLEFQAINPMGQVPAIVDGSFKLFESHAILIYLACAHGVADHWYPNDLSKRAQIHSVLDWHHSNLRRGAAPFVLNTVLAPALGLPLNPQAAAEGEKLLSSSLSTIESIWLKGSGKFLLGSSQPSIADLSLVCEIMQLEVLDDNDWNRVLDPHKKVQQWIEDTKNATGPHFDEVHKVLFKVKASLQKQQSNDGSSETTST